MSARIDTSQHPLARYGGGLVSGNPEAVVALDAQLRAVADALGRFEKGAVDARRIGADPDLSAEGKRRRQVERVADLRRALADALGSVAQPLRRNVEALRSEKSRTMQGLDAEENATRALLRHLRLAELRSELRAMEPGARVMALLGAARAGNREILDAVEGALAEIVPAGFVEKAREAWFEAAHAPLAERLGDAETLASEVERVARLALDSTAPSLLADPGLVRLYREGAEAASVEAQGRAMREALGLDPAARGWAPRPVEGHKLPEPATAGDGGGEATPPAAA